MTTVQSFAGRDYVSRPVTLPQAKPMFGRSNSGPVDTLSLSKNMNKTPKEPHFGLALGKTAILVGGGLAALAGALPQKTQETSPTSVQKASITSNHFHDQAHQNNERQVLPCTDPNPAICPPAPSTSGPEVTTITKKPATTITKKPATTKTKANGSVVTKSAVVKTKSEKVKTKTLNG